MTLGRLTEVDLRAEWPGEATHFTPWLAQEENLTELGRTLGLELELEAQERSVGPFRADILCKDIGQNAWVLVENQLERTDHTHLGQVMTYAAGLDAVTIVWIAARFTDEHRATLDWLNRITDETFKFFGVEVQLWRIGDSLSAPRFNIVAKPNDWSRAVKRAARGIDEAALSDLKVQQRNYWDQFDQALATANGQIASGRKAQPQSWMAYSIGRTGFALGAAISRPQNHIRAEIYISNPYAAGHFEQLLEDREAIEAELGYQLEWPDRTGKQDRRAYVALQMDQFEDTAKWPEQHEWLAKRLNELHRVFAGRVKALEDIDVPM